MENIAQSVQEKYDAQKKRNFERHQKRKVAATRRVPTAVTARVDNLQLFIGNDCGTDNTNEHSIVWNTELNWDRQEQIKELLISTIGKKFEKEY